MVESSALEPPVSSDRELQRLEQQLQRIQARLAEARRQISERDARLRALLKRHLPSLSPRSPLYLPYISPTSPLTSPPHLPSRLRALLKRQRHCTGFAFVTFNDEATTLRC